MSDKNGREEKMAELQEKLAALEAGNVGDDAALDLIDECIRLAGECA